MELRWIHIRIVNKQTDPTRNSSADKYMYVHVSYGKPPPLECDTFSLQSKRQVCI